MMADEINEAVVWIAEVIKTMSLEEVVALGSQEGSSSWSPTKWHMYAGTLGGAVLDLIEKNTAQAKEIEKLRRGR